MLLASLSRAASLCYLNFFRIKRLGCSCYALLELIARLLENCEKLRTREDMHSMKMFRILCLSAMVALPPLALAKLPAPNGVLGTVEGALDFCAQADPGSA